MIGKVIVGINVKMPSLSLSSELINEDNSQYYQSFNMEEHTNISVTISNITRIQSRFKK